MTEPARRPAATPWSAELTRSIGLLGSQRMAVAALGVVRTKIAAALLGPAGIGLLAQAIALQDLLRALSTLGSPNGFLKLVAQHRGRDDLGALARLLVTAALLFGGLAVAIAALCVLGAEPLAKAVFGEAGDAELIGAVALSLVFLVPGLLVGKVFAGLLDYRSYALLAVGESLLWVILLAGLASGFGLRGAIWSLPAVELAGLLAGGVLLGRRVVRPLGIDLRRARPSREALRGLLRIAGALALTSLACTAAALFVRSEIVRRWGASANGHYQVAWQVGQNYLAFLGAALWSYGMPRVAHQLADPDAVTATQNGFLRIALLAFAPGIVVLLTTREVWIPLLFSDAFLAAGTMVSWQLAGELAAMLRQSMNISLLPREKLGFLVFQGVSYWSLWALLAWLLLDALGALAAAVAYSAANAVVLAGTYAYHRRVLGFRVDSGNRRLLATTVPMFAIGAALAAVPGAPSRFAAIALVVLWAIVHRDELRPLWSDVIGRA